MCGRYTFASVKHLGERFSFSNKISIKPNYNVTPGSNMPVIVKNSPNKAVIMKWGLIPFWAKDPRIGYKLINARSETIHIKPAFKKSFQSKRCLIPADGFYEWAKKAEKTPFYIHSTKQKTFSFAGIYDTWTDAEGIEIQTFCILTTNANSKIKKIHPRMPVILSRKNEKSWLDRQTPKDILLPLLQPYPSKNISIHQVSSDVNNPVNNNPNLVAPITQHS